LQVILVVGQSGRATAWCSQAKEDVVVKKAVSNIVLRSYLISQDIPSPLAFAERLSIKNILQILIVKYYL
jgi:hypothetical protein